MKKYTILSVILLQFFIQTQAQTSNLEKDKETIKSLCGCFDVDFKYKETFSASKNYKPKDVYETGALEWVSYEPQPDGSVRMQHILIIDSSMIIKHWREDWSFENPNIYTYDKNYRWTKTKVDAAKVKGTWTQKVFEVDDRPQYDGVATFSYFDDKTLWQSTVDAPLPRREYSKRTDYNVLNRGNRLYISPTGYLHEQDNKKIKRTTGEKDTLIVDEKGVNIYKKIEESKCQAGIDWWQKNKVYWNDVRTVWTDLLPTLPELAIQFTVEDKKLYERLFKLNEDLIAEKKYDSKKAKEEILKAIKLHLITATDTNKPTKQTPLKSETY